MSGDPEAAVRRRPARQGQHHAVQRAAARAARGLPELPGRAARPGLHGGRGRRPAEDRARGRRQAADRHRRRSARSRARGDQVMTQIFKLSHENANNLVPVLRPLISPNNTINANPGNNSLVITDYADNLQRIGKIIAAMDTPRGGDVEVITLQHAVAADIAPLVQRLDRHRRHAAARRACPSAAARPARPRCMVDSRSNSLLVRAPNPARMSTVRALIDKLDQPAHGSRRPRQRLGRLPEERRRGEARDRAARGVRRSVAAPRSGGAQPRSTRAVADREPANTPARPPERAARRRRPRRR